MTTPSPISQLLGLLFFVVMVAAAIVTHRIVRRAQYRNRRAAAHEWRSDRRWLRTLRHPVPEAGDPWLTGPIPIPPISAPPLPTPASGDAA